MESHAVSARLHANRERLRALLLPEAGRGDGMFPRSAVMRFAFNPGARSLAMSLFSVLLMWSGRRHRRVPGSSLLPRLTRAPGGLIGTRRH